MEVTPRLSACLTQLKGVHRPHQPDPKLRYVAFGEVTGVYCRAESQAKVQGKSMSELVSYALVAYSPDMIEWSAKQSGHQTMMIFSLTLAMAKRTMNVDDINRARSMAGRAAELVVGGLGPPLSPSVRPPW